MSTPIIPLNILPGRQGHGRDADTQRLRGSRSGAKTAPQGVTIAGDFTLGGLRPILQTFQVCIAYRVPSVIEMLDPRRLQPRVRVLKPALRPRLRDREGQLPHVYYIGHGPLDVVLCMFDPDADEWSPTMTVAETTVPWTIDWLTSYEGWRATGEWTGGGRHVDQLLLQEKSA